MEGGTEMKKEVPLSEDVMNFLKSRHDGVRIWVRCSLEHLEEMIENGDAVTFQWQGRDYLIQWSGRGYYIQDPQIEKLFGTPCTDYPGNEAAKTPEELMALPFLDGKTIFERFDELRFFEG
jgi:hypothetical protein